MKNRTMFSLLICTALALAGQLLQTVLGYEAETGLPTHGLWLLLPVLAALILWFLAVRPLTADNAPAFPKDFPLTKNGLLLPLAGAGLVALSGAAWLAGALLPPTAEVISAEGTISSISVSSQVPSSTMLALGATALLLGVALIPTVISCLPRDGQGHSFNTLLLLAAPVVFVARSVLVYRIHSVDPVVGHYAVELLAMVTLTLAYYRLSGFGFGVGNTRRFGLYAGWAVSLSVAALAAVDFPDSLFYLGNALVLAGLLSARTAGANT